MTATPCSTFPQAGERLQGLDTLAARAARESQPLPSGGEISRTMIWDFAAAVQDGNPAYWDETWARGSRFQHLVVPPTMLLTHTRYPPGPAGTAAEWTPDYLREPRAPLADLLSGIAKQGCDVWTNASREEWYHEALAPGDQVVTAVRVELSEVKQTRLARGVFVTTFARHLRSSDGAEVARSKNVLFCYPSSDSTEVTPAPAAGDIPPDSGELGGDPPPDTRRDPFETLVADEVAVGDRIPKLAWKVDFMDLMRAAQGTRHPVPLHTDREFAQRAGSRDAYFSTLWQAGLIGRFVNDWAGPEAWLRHLRLTMMANICPGDTVTVQGSVVGRSEAGLADISIMIFNDLGAVSQVSASVDLPCRSH